MMPRTQRRHVACGALKTHALTGSWAYGLWRTQNARNHWLMANNFVCFAVVQCTAYCRLKDNGSVLPVLQSERPLS
jgi:hypothetical protein